MGLEMKFTVYGTPAPQGSKRHVGGGRMIESSKKVAPWREAVVWAFREAIKDREWTVISEPVFMKVTFSLQRPKSAPKRITRPAKYPDVSKLIRSTEDGMTTAGVYVDDALIVSIEAHKVFAGSAEGLEVPGAVIEVWTLDS
jgi:Holliday junction resolvase RusA-like endonuclease